MRTASNWKIKKTGPWKTRGSNKWKLNRVGARESGNSRPGGLSLGGGATTGSYAGE